jgi:hypothetical protein
MKVVVSVPTEDDCITRISSVDTLFWLKFAGRSGIAVYLQMDGDEIQDMKYVL